MRRKEQVFTENAIIVEEGDTGDINTAAHLQHPIVGSVGGSYTNRGGGIVDNGGIDMVAPTPDFPPGFITRNPDGKIEVVASFNGIEHDGDDLVLYNAMLNILFESDNLVTRENMSELLVSSCIVIELFMCHNVFVSSHIYLDLFPIDFENASLIRNYFIFSSD